MGTAPVLSVNFNQIEKAKKLAKWNITVSDDDIIICVVNQMHEPDWFLEEIMTKWKDTKDKRKTWQT